MLVPGFSYAKALVLLEHVMGGGSGDDASRERVALGEVRALAVGHAALCAFFRHVVSGQTGSGSGGGRMLLQDSGVGRGG